METNSAKVTEDHSDTIDERVDIINDSEVIEEENTLNNSVTNDINGSVQASKSPNFKHVRLPLARVKHIMKMDPDCHLVNQDAVFLVVKATELFLEYMAKESYKYTCGNKRKTIMRRDVDSAIDSTSHLCFLDGALE